MNECDIDRCVEYICDLCRVPSPTGYTGRVAKVVSGQLEALGFKPTQTRKGSVVCNLGGTGTPLGGYPALYLLTESCEMHTRDGRTSTGTFQPVSPAVHVNTKLAEFKPTEENVEVVLDLPVSSADEVVELGRRGTLLLATYEEVGHGGSAGIPEDTQEMISVDIYPRYGSDVEATLRAGFDIVHGLIGPGVSASHAYERTHRDGIEATLGLLAPYVSQPGREP